MKKYAVLLALLVLSTSAWGYTVGTCGTNQCGNPCSNPCWNPCPSPCQMPASSYTYTSGGQCVKPVCGPVVGVTSWQNGCGFQISGCMGSFGAFNGSGGSHTFGCGPIYPFPTNTFPQP
jgi:hypothetical protein